MLKGRVSQFPWPSNDQGKAEGRGMLCKDEKRHTLNPQGQSLTKFQEADVKQPFH